MRESKTKRVENYSKEKTSPEYKYSSSSPRARARRERFSCGFDEAGDAARTIIHEAFRHRTDVRTTDNLRLWSWYCRRFDRGAILDKAFECASRERQGEIKSGVTAFQAWLGRTYGNGAKGGAR